MRIAITRSKLFLPIALLALLVLAAVVPRSWLQPLDAVGYAVCHRIPERSFIVGGTQLPVCARDTGMFGAALLGVVFLASTSTVRATGFTPRKFGWVFTLFFLAWGFDGFNSYMLLLRGQPLFYMPQNWLRLVTGTGMGLSLAVFIVPLFHQATWQLATTHDQPAVHSWRTVAQLVLLSAFFVVLVLWQPAFLYGAFAMLSALGVLVMLSIVNGLLLLLLFRRASTLVHTRQVVLPLLIGLGLSLAEIALINMLRAAFTQAYGLPF